MFPIRDLALSGIGGGFFFFLYGLAADIVVTAGKVADYAETLLPNTGGIGRYKGFTHVDVRKKKSRWNG